MATTSKYFVITPVANDLASMDFEPDYGMLSLVGQEIQFVGSRVGPMRFSCGPASASISL